MNQIFLMMSLTMMGLTPGPLVRSIFLIFPFVLTILLAVLVAWGLTFSCQQESTPNVIFAFIVFVPIGVESNSGQPIKKNWRSNSLLYFQI